MAQSKSGLNGTDSPNTGSAKRRVAPPTPGDVLREFLLANDRITQEDLARSMRVSRVTINQLVNDHRTVTAAMALRLARALSTTPDFWLNLQRAVDLVEAQHRLGRSLGAIRPVRLPISKDALFYDPTG